jgi:hypothetical protein
MDITQEILDDHAEQRKLFATLEQIGPADLDALTAVPMPGSRPSRRRTR